MDGVDYAGGISTPIVIDNVTSLIDLIEYL